MYGNCLLRILSSQRLPPRPPEPQHFFFIHISMMIHPSYIATHTIFCCSFYLCNAVISAHRMKEPLAQGVSACLHCAAMTDIWSALGKWWLENIGRRMVCLDVDSRLAVFFGWHEQHFLCAAHNKHQFDYEKYNILISAIDIYILLFFLGIEPRHSHMSRRQSFTHNCVSYGR